MVVVLDSVNAHCRYMPNIPEYIPKPGNNGISLALAGYKLKYIERISYHIRTIQDT